MKATVLKPTLIAILALLFSFNDITNGEPVSRRAVEDFLITFSGCERDLDNISGADIKNVKCNYNINPGDSIYSADLYGWTGVRGDDCTPTLPKPESVEIHGNGSNITFTGVGINGTFSAGFDIDRQFFDQTDDEEIIHFCIRYNLLIDLNNGDNPITSIYFMKTFLTVRFFLDGSFELNADSKGPVGPGFDDDKFTGDDDTFNLVDDDPTNGGGINVTENITESETADEFSKLYSVFAYQCGIEFPHPPVDDIIYQGDLLGICVETLFPDTYIADVLRLQLLQDDGLGNIISTSPVSLGSDNAVTSSTCALDNRIASDNSKCFIQTSMLSMFFVSQNIVNATGEVDLLIRTTTINTRRLSRLSRGLQSIISEYYVATKVGTSNDVAPKVDAKSASILTVSSFSVALLLSTLTILFIA